MKNLLNVAIIAIVILFSSCSVESIDTLIQNPDTPEETQTNNIVCVDSDPQAQLTNNGTVSFNFKVYNTDGSFVVEVLNVMPGTTTSIVTFNSGDIMFNIESTSSGISDQKVIYTMNNCSEISLEVDANNVLLDTAPTSL